MREEKRSVDGDPVSEIYTPPPYVDAVHPVNVVSLTLILCVLVRLAEIAPPLPEVTEQELK